MLVRFSIGGECLFETELDCLPAQGAEIIFVAASTGRGIPAGSLVAGRVSIGAHPIFDFSAEPPRVILSLDQAQVMPPPGSGGEPAS
ncbi:hypothetical protein [Rhizorhabdus phycosphaerae]|uniref:hypothetical protein n=1 Tax=Rhizorhabdus phycosphaerae TaxID=2711156 RepID=UPI0019D23AA1|nr:hypothetical protein [Rhizorhabdus phycosphaerae]